MEIVLDPPYGAGPLSFGMDDGQARAALAVLGEPVSGALGELALVTAGGLRISAGFGVAGPTARRVNAVEVWRGGVDEIVRFRDVDVFRQPVAAVLRELRRHGRVVEDPWDLGVVLPDLYLALGGAEADAPDEDRFFMHVLVARPGYGDTPAEAAARLAAGELPGY